MQEDNNIIKTNSLLYEEFAADDETPVVDPIVIDEVSPVCTASPSSSCCVTVPVSFSPCEANPIKTVTVTPDLSGGRILTVQVNLSNVCCPSRVTVGVVICDSNNNLVALKVQTITIGSSVTPTPAPGCTAVADGVFCFALDNVCSSETFTIRAVANYSFMGVTCPPCTTTTTTPV